MKTSRIWEYSCRAWSEKQADKYYKILTDSFQDLAGNPHLGKRYNEIDSNLSGFRVGKHIVFYRTTPAGHIEILRILHQSMDLKSRIEA